MKIRRDLMEIFFISKQRVTSTRFILAYILVLVISSCMAQDPDLPPGENFDLSRWKITLPDQTEPSETDLVNGFESPDEFYTDPTTGAMVFKCPNNAETGGSTYPRSELREMLRAGNTSISTQGIGLNNWVFSSSTIENQTASGGVDGTMNATVAVDHVSTTGEERMIGRVIIGQIHASDDEPCRLYYRKLPGNSKGSIYIAHEPTTSAEQWYDMIGDRSDDASDPEDGIALGEKFSYEIKVVFNTLTVTIMREGKDDVVQVVDMTDSGFADDWMYFKAGNYNQNNSGEEGEYAQVSFFELEVTHSTPNIAPSISFTSPSNNDSFIEGNNITLTADASDDDGTISKVEFFEGDNLLGEDTSSPYTFIWENVAEGNYLLTAKATDNSGLGITSVPGISITVNSQPTEYDAPYDIPKFQTFIGECKLQAPTSATIATQTDLINGYTSDNFYVVEGDRVAFNQSGESMRTELRDLTNWTLSEGDRSFHGSLKFVEQTCDQVTVVQIHDDANAGDGPNKPLLRIYRHLDKTPVDHIWAAIKTDDGGVNTTHIDMGPSPTDYFDFDVLLSSGNMIIFINGEEKVNTDVSFWNYPSYWKAGVYLQDEGEATAYFNELYEGDGSEVNHAPSVSITAPNNGDSFVPGSDITITADAIDTDGSVSKVEFFQGNNKLGEDDSSPYSFTWNNVPKGDYTLTAKATDNEDGSRTSLGVDITVILQYELTTATIGEGSISLDPSGGVYDENTVVNLTATPASGHQFDGWSGDASGTENPLEVTMDADKNVTANFSEIVTYTLTTTVVGNGSISAFPSGGTYLENATVELSASPDEGYEFSGWSGDVTAPQSSILVTMNSDKSITANFDPVLGLEDPDFSDLLVYPNPLVSKATFEYELFNSSSVKLTIHDVSGKLINELINAYQQAGTHQVEWNVTDSLETGLYFVKLKIGNETKSSRIILDR